MTTFTFFQNEKRFFAGAHYEEFSIERDLSLEKARKYLVRNCWLDQDICLINGKDALTNKNSRGDWEYSASLSSRIPRRKRA